MAIEKTTAPRIVAVLVVMCLASSAWAGVAMPSTANIVEVTATSAQGETLATFAELFPVDAQIISGTYMWNLPAPVTLRTGTGAPVATVNSLSVTYQADPQVLLTFDLINTDPTNPVSFSVASGAIGFVPSVPNAVARASTSITLTDGATDGASITGTFTNGGIYQARYSNTSPVNSGTVFSNLVGPVSFGPGGVAASVSDHLGTYVNPIPLNTTAYMMEAEFSFVLSAGDEASGTSQFVITPEPTSMLLLSLGSVLALRRRSHR
jgi:hypothetical protein